MVDSGGGEPEGFAIPVTVGEINLADAGQIDSAQAHRAGLTAGINDALAEYLAAQTL